MKKFQFQQIIFSIFDILFSKQRTYDFLFGNSYGFTINRDPVQQRGPIFANTPTRDLGQRLFFSTVLRIPNGLPSLMNYIGLQIWSIGHQLNSVEYNIVPNVVSCACKIENISVKFKYCKVKILYRICNFISFYYVDKYIYYCLSQIEFQSFLQNKNKTITFNDDKARTALERTSATLSIQLRKI